MRRIKQALQPANIEAGLAMIGFAGNSGYWLVLAFLMSAHAYGELMTLQAAVLLVVSAATFRTYDLYFNLLAQRGQAENAAYRIVRRSEMAAAALATVLVVAGAAIFLLPAGRLEVFAIAVGYGVLSSLGANQGAAIAHLRHAHRGDIIAKTDAVAALLWGLAAVSAIFAARAHALLPLILGAAPPFVRSVLLAAAARKVVGSSNPADIRQPEQAGDVARYLLGAQLTNFLKNGAISIETVILATFAPAPIVAMYRVARGLLGIGVAALNVAYQRVYPALARAISVEQFRAAVSSLERRSLLICLATFPLSAITALAYAWLKPGVGIVDLQVLTLAMFAASLPSAFQQGAFAILSLRGEHRAANTAYVLWFAVLGVGAVVLLWLPRIEVFMGSLILAGLARLAYLRHRARAGHGNAFAGLNAAQPASSNVETSQGAPLPNPSAPDDFQAAGDV